MTPLEKGEARNFIALRHPEWSEHQRVWRFLGDSYEGGNIYRFADYSADHVNDAPNAGYRAFPYAAAPAPTVDGLPGYYAGGGGGIDYASAIDCNLVPHRSEMTPQGWDKYNLRLSRTPVPRLHERVVRRSLSRIYAQEVQRKAPSLPALEGWWDDVDGLGTPIDKWMRKVVAPQILIYGLLDLSFGHPFLDPGQPPPKTKAHDVEMDMGRCVAGYILPQNMLWYRTDRHRRYIECLVLERDDEGRQRFRHWDAEGWVLYGKEGEEIARANHPFGRVPIIRVFDERKLRCFNVGQPRYEGVAEIQRALYNADSERVLQNVFQSGATLAVPKELLTPEGEMMAGPAEIWPMVEGRDGTFQAPAFVARPKGSADDLIRQMEDWKDEADRDSSLAKPAGAAGKGTVAQSGISKAFDSQEANAILSEISETFADSERAAALMANLVLSDGKSTPKDAALISIEYPKEFELYSAEDLAAAMSGIHDIMENAGVLTEVEKEAVNRLVRALLPGLSEERSRELTKEVADAIDAKADRQKQALEAGPILPGGQGGDDLAPTDQSMTVS